MIVSVLQDNLSTALGYVDRVIDKSPVLPVLGNFLLETDDSRLKISGTNLETSVTVWIGAKVERPGRITLPAKIFRELVNSLARERIDMKVDETDTVKIRCGTQTTNIRGISADDCPPIKHNTNTHAVVEGSALREAIQHTVVAASKEYNRPILMGVYMKFADKITMAAADGYRLAVRYFDPVSSSDYEAQELEAQELEENECVLPVDALNTIRAMASNDDQVVIGFADARKSITFQLPNILISTQLLEGKFPDFEAIIPNSHTTETILYSKNLLTVCQRVFIFSRDNANTATFKTRNLGVTGEPAEVTISGVSAERGDSEGKLDATGHGEELSISFNVKYFIDLLKIVKEERVIMRFNGPENPGVIRPENRDDFVYVVMPMSA